MNIPNTLSLFRLFLVPAFLLVFFSGMPYSYAAATGIFLLAGLTDVLDGYLARKYGQITVLGRVLDPLADKLMVMSVLTAMSLSDMIPLVIAILYVVKETLQILGSVLLLRYIKDMPPSNIWGKTATVLFYAAITVSMMIDLSRAAEYALFAPAFIAVFAAMASYVSVGVRLLKEISK